MWKAVLVGTASLMLAGSSLVYAQQQSGAPAAAKPAAATPAAPSADQQLVMAEHMAAFAAANMAALKAGLKLTPDQEKNWPAFEKAMDEMTKLESSEMGPPPAAAAPPTEAEPEDPVAALQKRADESFKEATALKHLADAIGPLYASLDEKQKLRFHTLAPPVLSFHLNNGEQNQQYGGMPGEMGQPGAGGYGEQMAGAPPQGGYGGPMMGAPQQGGYGGPMMGAPQQGGYGGPMMGAPQQGGYGGPMMGAPQQGGYGGPMMGAPQQGGYGGPMMGAPQQGGYSGPMMGAPQQGGYSGPMMGAPQQGGYGGPMMGAPPQQGAYAGPMGAPAQQGGPMMMMGGEGAQGMSQYGGAPYGQNTGSGYEPYQQGQEGEEGIDE